MLRSLPIATVRRLAGWSCLIAWLVLAVVPLGHALHHDATDHVHTETGIIQLDGDHAHDHDSHDHDPTDVGHGGPGHYAHHVTIEVTPLPELVTDGYARLAAGESLASITGEDAAEHDHAHGEHGAHDHGDAHGGDEHHAQADSVGSGPPSADGLGHAEGPAHFQVVLVRAIAATIVLQAGPDPSDPPPPLWRASVHTPAFALGADLARGPPGHRPA